MSGALDAHISAIGTYDTRYSHAMYAYQREARCTTIEHTGEDQFEQRPDAAMTLRIEASQSPRADVADDAHNGMPGRSRITFIIPNSSRDT
jgi:hypothetical protein